MRRRVLPALALVLVSALVAGTAWALLAPSAGPAGSQPAATSTQPQADRPARPPDPASASSASSVAALPPSCEDLSLRRRAALVLVVGMPEVTAPTDGLVGDLASMGVGGVFLNGYNVTSSEQVGALVRAIRSGSAPVPLIAVDEEGGRVSSLRTLLGSSSSPRTLAATQSPAEVRAVARDLGASLADLGVDWNLAPVADLDSGPSDGVIGDRAFAGDPDEAGAYAAAFARGLDAAGILPTVKHFPGHGAVPTDVDPHSRKVPSDVSLRELRRRHLPPFARLIAGDVPVVMLNHVTYRALDDLPASMSPRAYRLLRDLGFDGVAITDSVGMGAVHRRWDFPAAAEQALVAGADAVLATDGTHARAMRRRLVSAVRAGRLPEQRLNEAAGRMLLLHGDAGMCAGR